MYIHFWWYKNCICYLQMLVIVACLFAARIKLYRIHFDFHHLSPGWGGGYAWSPDMLTIDEGDTVCFEWKAPKYVLDVPVYKVEQTALPTSREYDGVGFRSAAEGTSEG